MTTKQKFFASAFITNGGNAAGAAREVGYSPRGAKVTANKLLNRPDVQSAIDEKLEELASARVADERELLEFLSACVRGQVTETIVVNSGKAITAPIRCSQRIDAAEMLLKIYGAFRRQEQEQNDGLELFVQTLEKIGAKRNAAQED